MFTPSDVSWDQMLLSVAAPSHVGEGEAVQNAANDPPIRNRRGSGGVRGDTSLAAMYVRVQSIGHKAQR